MHWYKAALITFQQGGYVTACTYMRRGIATNLYIVEEPTGYTVMTEHLYWQASNELVPELAIYYLESVA